MGSFLNRVLATPAQRQKFELSQVQKERGIAAALAAAAATLGRGAGPFVGRPGPDIGSLIGESALGVQAALQGNRQAGLQERALDTRNALGEAALRNAQLAPLLALSKTGAANERARLDRESRENIATSNQSAALQRTLLTGSLTDKRTALNRASKFDIANLNNEARKEIAKLSASSREGVAAAGRKGALERVLLTGSLTDKRAALNRATKIDIAGLNNNARAEIAKLSADARVAAAQVSADAPSKRIVNVVQRNPGGDDTVLATGRAESPEVLQALQQPNAFIGTPSRNVSVFGKTFEALSAAADTKARNRTQNKALDSVRQDAGVLVSFARSADRANKALDKGGDSVLSITGTLANFGNTLKSQANALSKEFGLNTSVDPSRFTGRLSFLAQLSAGRRAGLLNLAIVNARLSGQKGALSDGDVERALTEIGARTGSKETAKAMLQASLVGALERVGDQVETRLDPDFLTRATNIRADKLRSRVEGIVGVDFLNKPLGTFGNLPTFIGPNDPGFAALPSGAKFLDSQGRERTKR